MDRIHQNAVYWKYNNKKYSQSAIMMHACDICKKKKNLWVKTIRSPKPYILDPILAWLTTVGCLGRLDYPFKPQF